MWTASPASPEDLTVRRPLPVGAGAEPSEDRPMVSLVRILAFLTDRELVHRAESGPEI